MRHLSYAHREDVRLYEANSFSLERPGVSHQCHKCHKVNDTILTLIFIDLNYGGFFFSPTATVVPESIGVGEPPKKPRL